MKNIFLTILTLITSNFLLAQEKDKTFNVMFSGIELYFESSDIWTADSVFSKTHKDSVVIEVGLGENLDNLKFKITKKELPNGLKVFEKYETSISISDEGAHLDLLNWKHFYSEQKQLEIQNGEFITDSISKIDSQRFPIVSTEEIKNQVIKVTGNADNKFYYRAIECKNANGYPCYVSVSRRILTIEYMNNTGLKEHKVIIFNLPMGC
jgi:hypothetical protein